MSRQETSMLLSEILVTSRALVELGEVLVENEPSRLCDELRLRRSELLDRLRIASDLEDFG